MQPEYWAQTVTDAYYSLVDSVSTYSADLAANQDWTVWEEDNSNNELSPYCIYNKDFFSPAVEKWQSIYECTQVRCTMRRLLTTTDLYD